MRIVNRETFMAMPSGTLFAKYAPCYFEGMAIKGDTIMGDGDAPIDWFYQDIIPHFVESHDTGEWVTTLTKLEDGFPHALLDYQSWSRDGCFEDEQLFAIWSAADLSGLITCLMSAFVATKAHETAHG